MHQGKSHAGEARHAKEELGRGGGAHREWCGAGAVEREGEIGNGCVCLVPD